MATLTFIPTASSGGGSPFDTQITWQDGLALSASGTILGPSDDAISVFAADSNSLLIGSDTVVSDVVPGTLLLQAQSAKAQAVANKTGADASIGGGIGVRKITITDYTQIAGVVIGLVVNTTETDKTEGVNWTAAVSNDATASSLAAALDSITGITAVALSNVVYLTKEVTTYALTGFTSDYAATGIVLSCDVFFGEEVFPLPAEYLGGAVEGSVLLGGSGVTRLSCPPTTDASFQASPFGFLRVSNPVASLPLYVTGNQAIGAGIQIWPKDYNTGYTDTSYENLDILSNLSGNNALILTNASGAGHNLPSMQIGTGYAVNGATTTGAGLFFVTVGTTCAGIDEHQNLLTNLAGNGNAKGTNDTNGFFYIPVSAGAPVGTPAVTAAGYMAAQYDSTNKKLWIYDSVSAGWKFVALT